MYAPLKSRFGNMTFLGKVSDMAFLVVAYPIVLLYLHLYSDATSRHATDAAELTRRYEIAAKAAMKERKKCEPRALWTKNEEISTRLPSPISEPQLFSQWKRRKPQQKRGRLSLLLDLPLEIRENIYSNILGNNTLHITQLPGRLGHIRCTQSGIICKRECFHPNHLVQTYRYGEFLDMNATSENSLALLQTCRQIYHESSDILYRTNTFDINHPQTLIFLARTIRPSCLNSIRHLNLTWSGVLPFIANEPSKAPDDLQTWEQTWDIIGRKMTNLHDLKVRMLIYDDEGEKSRSGPYLRYARKRWTANGSQFENLLENMKGSVRGLRDFRLVVELPEAAIEWNVGEMEKKLRAAVCSPRTMPPPTC